MTGVTPHGIRYPDGSTRAKNLGPELQQMAEDIDQFIDEQIDAESEVFQGLASAAVSLAAPPAVSAALDAAAPRVPRVEEHPGLAAAWRDRTWRVSARITSDGQFHSSGAGGGSDVRRVAFFDDFRDRPDETATQTGWRPFGVAVTGQKWGVRVANVLTAEPRIEDGALTANSTTYFEAETDAVRPITRLGCEMSWNSLGGTLTDRGTLAIISWGDQGSVNGDRMSPKKWGRTVCHFRANRDNFSLEYQDDPLATSPEVVRPLEIGTPWAVPMVEDGRTYWIDLLIDRSSHTITVVTSWAGTYTMTYPEIDWHDDTEYGPAGETYACWEPFLGIGEGKTIPRLHRVWADHGPQSILNTGIPEVTS